jgi:hypothetical protein
MKNIEHLWAESPKLIQPNGNALGLKMATYRKQNINAKFRPERAV